LGDFGGRAEDILWESTSVVMNCAFSDISGPDLTRRAVAFCMDIAICHRRKFGQVWRSPAPVLEVAGNFRCRKAPYRPKY